MWGAFRSLLETNGIKGLFQGFTATAARDAPYAGMSLVFYEKGKDLAGRSTLSHLSTPSKQYPDNHTRVLLIPARLLKPEWGVPNAALHSGSGGSIVS